MYPKINKNSTGYTGGIIVLLTQQRISYEFPDLKGINKIFIYSMAHYIIIKEFTSTDSSKRLILRLIFILVASKIKTSNLHETFLKKFL